MSDLRTRLQTFYGTSTARLLARAAPLTLLAGGIGTTVAAVIARPDFATSGWGIILGGLAVNLTSSLVYEIVNAPNDDERTQIIEQGIAQQDGDVLTLSAAVLTSAGSELAQALPEPSRRELIAGLEQGMRQAGGPLAAIAPRYVAALRDTQTDWAALQPELRQIISVRQTLDIGEEALNQGSGQRVERPDGPVEQNIRIARGGKNIDSPQVVIGSGGQRPGHSSAIGEDANADSAPGDRSHNRRLLRSHTRRLQELENRAATEGLATPPHVVTEIEDIRREIARLQTLLEKRAMEVFM